MTERKMATIRKISDISPIPDADAIDLATVDGWKIVVKKNEFKVDDLVIYCEIDSWIPTEIAPFLSKGKDPREYNGVKGERLRTIKLRGQISQGLILPIPTGENTDGLLAFNIGMNIIKEGEDVSSILNIQKYEAPIPACLAGVVRGNFPSFIPKTDQERIQNLTKVFERYKQFTWEVTEKLDGSSCTFYFKDDDFGVCSRNLDLKEDYTNTFWRMAAQYDVETKLINLGKNIAIQGEVIGEGIQGNPYKITGQQFHVFDVFDIDSQTYYNGAERRQLVVDFGLVHAPVLEFKTPIYPSTTIDDLLLMAEAKSRLNTKSEREGLVFKCEEDPSISFKAISNRFLIKSDN
jgi:RNA ligase (TIGR02306 family)